MLARTLAFISGIYCLLQFSSLPSLWLVASLPLFYLLSRFYFIFRLILFFSLGFCWALFVADLKLTNKLDSEFENKDILIKGTVTSLPETYENHIRFLFKIDAIKSINEEFLPYQGNVRLSWYQYNVKPVPGDVWQLKVKLKKPYGFMNFNGFDYEAWMLRKGIQATGYVKQDKHNGKIDAAGAYYIQKLRYNIAEELKQKLDNPLLGLTLALSLGERSELKAKQWKVLTQTGTNHLIAISGLHLSLVAGFIYCFAYFIWSRFHFLTQRLSAPLFASIAAFIYAFFYAMLSGFALPTQRALIMLAVFLAAIFSVKQFRASSVISIALLLVLILDPFALMAVDFYLSFLAVMFIFYITRFRINEQSRLAQWLRLQCLLSLTLFPVLIFWFNHIPIYSVLANLVAIPIVGFLIVPLTLIALIFLFPFPNTAELLYELINLLNDVYWRYLEYLSELNHAVIPIATPNFITLVLAIIGVLILTMPKGLPGRILGLFFMLPILFPITHKLNHGEFDFVLLDVGQGLAAVVKTKRHVLVYDTGAYFSKKFNIGDAVLGPYLKSKGIKELSTLLISHGDNDHIGGADAIIDAFKINRILTSVPEKINKHKTKYTLDVCQAGQFWHWDGVSFEILHPQQNNSYMGNNASCVIKISAKHGSVLLTGDIEKEAELHLVEEYGNNLNADILLVPHHGSKTSSTSSFISAVSPRLAFISAGYRNRFGLPKKDIIERYDKHHVKTLISFESGEISAKFRNEGLQIDEFRTKNKRFWHH